MGSVGGAFGGSVMNGDRSTRLDFRAQDWYTRANRANVKPLILLILLKRRGNPSLSPLPFKTPAYSNAPAVLTPALSISPRRSAPLW